jgi:hypothetical protein
LRQLCLAHGYGSPRAMPTRLWICRGRFEI